MDWEILYLLFGCSSDTDSYKPTDVIGSAKTILQELAIKYDILQAN